MQCIHQVIQSAHIQEGLLLSGKRCVREVFGCCRGTNGNRDVATVRHRLPGGFDVGHEAIGQCRLCNPSADHAAGTGQCVDVVDIQRLQQRMNPVGQAVSPEEFPVRRRRGRETAGNVNAQAAQVGYHFAKGCIFTADCVDITHAELIQPDDVRLQT